MNEPYYYTNCDMGLECGDCVYCFEDECYFPELSPDSALNRAWLAEN